MNERIENAFFIAVVFYSALLTYQAAKLLVVFAIILILELTKFTGKLIVQILIIVLKPRKIGE